MHSNKTKRKATATPLGNLIALARELKGWSQRDLAAKANVSHVVIAHIELGYSQEPSFHNVAKIAKALGLSMSRISSAALMDDK